jgi:hypothetical protein
MIFTCKNANTSYEKCELAIYYNVYVYNDDDLCSSYLDSVLFTVGDSVSSIILENINNKKMKGFIAGCSDGIGRNCTFKFITKRNEILRISFNGCDRCKKAFVIKQKRKYHIAIKDRAQSEYLWNYTDSLRRINIGGRFLKKHE